MATNQTIDPDTNIHYERSHYARVIITLIPEEEADESDVAMRLPESAFDEWSNEPDSIYDAL